MRSGQPFEGPVCEDFPPFIQLLLKEMSGSFKTFVLGNSKALSEKKKSFVVQTHGEATSYLTRPYVEKSRQMLLQVLGSHLKTVQQREAFSQVLKSNDLQDLYNLETLAAKI